MTQKIIVISASSLNMIESCFKSYEFYKKDNLILVDNPEFFDRGDLIHQMAEEYYQAKIDGEKDHGLLIQKAVDRGRFAATKLELDSDNVEQYIKSFREYAQYYSSDGWRPLAVEQPFSFVIYEDENLKIIFEGKIDLIVELESDGTKIIVDHKSKEKASTPSPLDNQIIGYKLWAKTVGIDTFIINDIGIQKTLPPIKKFRRHTMDVAPIVFEEWIDATVYHIRNLAICIEQDYYPRNYRSCKFCSYGSICKEQLNMRDATIKMLYMKKPEHTLFPNEN